MRLVFVRHGQTYANAEERLQGRDDTELSPTGRAQAEKLSRRFEEEEFSPTHVYSSPLRRHYHPCYHRKRSKLPLQVLERLKWQRKRDDGDLLARMKQKEED